MASFLTFFHPILWHSFPKLPLSVSDIVLFVAYLSAKKLAPSTISTYISALSYVHKIGSFSDPTKAFVVHKIMTAQSRLCSKLDIRLPITRSILHKLVQALNHTITPAYQILLFQTMFLVAFYGFFSSGWTNDQDPWAATFRSPVSVTVFSKITQWSRGRQTC